MNGQRVVEFFGENVRRCQNIPHGLKGTGSTFFIKYE
jgi:hypothetical protein